HHEASDATVRIVTVGAGHVGARVLAAGEPVQGRFVGVAAETWRRALGRRLGRGEGLEVARLAAAAVDVRLSRAVACLAGALVGRARGVVELRGWGGFRVAPAPVGMAGGACLGSCERRGIRRWTG